MKNFIDVTVTCAALLTLLLMGAAGCRRPPLLIPPPPPGVVVNEPGPPPHAPARGRRAKHAYHYYPSVGVYFDLSQRSWFYLEGSAWKVSATLPDRIRVGMGDAVSLELDTDRPYLHHDEHKKKYPPGQLKKQQKEKGKGKGNNR